MQRMLLVILISVIFGFSHVNNSSDWLSHSPLSSRVSCGGVIDADRPGFLHTPQYPANIYNQSCSWSLETSSAEKRIFIDCSVHLSQTAYESVLFISKDGRFLPANTVVYAKNELEISEYSEGSNMGLYFSTRFSVQGLQCNYSTKVGADRQAICGGWNSADHFGFFQTPNYVYSYSQYDHCLWTIERVSGPFVMTCSIDTDDGLDYFLVSRDGTFNPRYMVSYTGAVGRQKIVSVGRSMAAVFHSSSSNPSRGVYCTWDPSTVADIAENDNKTVHGF